MISEGLTAALRMSRTYSTVAKQLVIHVQQNNEHLLAIDCFLWNLGFCVKPRDYSGV